MIIIFHVWVDRDREIVSEKMMKTVVANEFGVAARRAAEIESLFPPYHPNIKVLFFFLS